MATAELSMKLLIEAKSQKVCFAEAGSDVVEFLTGLLSLPLGTVTSLLTKDRMVGSTEKMNANYKSNELPLGPAVTPAALSHLQDLLGVQLGNDNSNNNSNLYACEGKQQAPPVFGFYFATTCKFSGPSGETYTKYLSAARGSVCPGCSCPMNMSTEQRLVVGTKRSAATTTTTLPAYTVGDDLSVTPAPNVVSGITLLARCGVKDLSTLQEKTVKIGKEEALGILAASLSSKTVLSDVFLPKRSARCKREAPEEVIQI